MKPAKFIIGAIIFFGILLGGAFSWDASRSLNQAYEAVLAAEREVQSQEERFLSSTRSFSFASAELNALAEKYRGARTSEDKRRIFAELSAASQRLLLGGEDPSNPLKRRLYDEISGALNRRQFAERHLGEVIAKYNGQATSFGGQIARTLNNELPQQIISAI